jgi:uncharacterized delta-60 repeat protein
MTSFRATIALAMVALASLTATSAALAAVPGDLDLTFGGTGKVHPPFGPESGAGGLAVQPDGRILVTGSAEASAGFSVARLLPNGSPDPSWGGGDGVVTTPLGEFAAALDVALQADGKVVAVGQAMGAKNEDFAIVRYLSNGELDPGFGEGGIVILPVGELGDTARAVAIGPGGRIAVTGTSDRPSFGLGAGVAVLESDGTPEAAFAADGTTVIETESGFDDRGEGIAVQPDGKVLIADSTGAGGGDGFTLIRLGLDGKPDPSFGGDGIVETPIPGEGGIESGRISDVVIQPDGKIVGGGYGFDYTGEPPEYVGKFELVRYLENGELDLSFGSGGMVGVRPPGGHSFGRALGLAADGKLVLGGTYDPNESPLEEQYAPALVRVNPNGSLDGSFGAGGLVFGPLAGEVEDESLEGLAIQPDGKILTAGYQSFATGYEAVVSRYIANFEAPLPKPPSPDLPPRSKIKGVPRKVQQGVLKGFRGTASDPDGSVAKVQVSLVRRSGGKAGVSAAVRPTHWRTAKGTSKWALKLKHPLAPGRYVVFSRAIDDKGLAESAFSKRDHNRYAFRVLPASR